MNLRKLRETTSYVLENLPRTIKGPINWGDLSCFGAEVYVNDDGDTGYRVWIAEVGSDSVEFQLAVQQALAQIGFQDIAVATEW
jgi:hypothetical protein